jgi:hypothetical protein
LRYRTWRQPECCSDARPPEDMARSLFHGYLYPFEFPLPWANCLD